MRHRLNILLACLFLASCGSTGDDASRPTPQASLLVPCAAPVELPARAMDDQQIEVMWGRDRSALRQCGAQLGALVQTLAVDAAFYGD